MEKTLQTTHKPPLTAFFVDDLPVDTQKKSALAKEDALLMIKLWLLKSVIGH